MKNTFSSGNDRHFRPAGFATFVSGSLFALGVALTFWAAATPVAQATSPSPTPHSPTPTPTSTPTPTPTPTPTSTPAPTSSPTPTPGRGHQECVVCHNVQHNPHTITIDCNALKAHLAHGDYEGPCQPTPTPTPKPTPSATPTPGQGHQKCVVCHNVQHNPHTITIDCHALKAHLAHGDTEGPCQATPTPTPKKDCTVCHNGKDKPIPCDKVDDWLSHHPGDTEGPCVPTPDTNR